MPGSDRCQVCGKGYYVVPDGASFIVSHLDCVWKIEQKAQRFRDYADSADRQCEREKKRAEQAEAEVGRLTGNIADFKAQNEALTNLTEKLYENVKQLQCCGNCVNETWATDNEEPCTLCHPDGHDGPPSRWQPREETT